MTYKKTNSLIPSTLTTVLFLMLLLLTVGCVTKEEVVYKKIYFADTNGITTTIYYPKSFKKDLRMLSSLHMQSDKERWNHKAPKDAPDDGVAKEMRQ
jgi:hypothetical protein